MDNRSFLLNEFSNLMRLDILKFLFENPMTFTTLSKKLNISSSEVSRHLTRLIDQGFIKKQENTRNYELSSLGKTTLLIFAPLDFVFSHAKYFQSHDLSNLPISLIRNLDALKNSDLIEGTGLLMIKMKEVAESPENEMWIMVDQPFPFGKTGLDVKYITPPEMAKFGTQAKKTNRSTEAKYLNEITTALAWSDTMGWILCFPNLEGKPDFSAGFFINNKDTDGCNFCKKLWDYYWELSKKYEN
ncbi:MAG: ArsR family transcriptional regulator [Candidatus Helarchaeota archaeon]